jgi:hypothetical protein
MKQLPPSSALPSNFLEPLLMVVNNSKGREKVMSWEKHWTEFVSKAFVSQILVTYMTRRIITPDFAGISSNATKGLKSVSNYIHIFN